MQGRGQGARFDDALRAGCTRRRRSEEGEAVVPAYGVKDAEATVEVDEGSAAADEDVLAVIDDLAGAGMFIGGGASADVGTTLEKMDTVASVGERACGGEAGKTSTDDGDGFAAGRQSSAFLGRGTR